MQPIVFSTRSLPAAQQYEAWRSWFDPVFEAVPTDQHATGFRADIRSWGMDGVVISHVSAPALSVVRTRSLIRRSPVDHWNIVLGRRTTGFSTPRQDVEVPPGRPFLLSIGSEMTSRRTGDERLQLYLARDACRELAPLLDGACGTVLAGELGRLFADYLVMVRQRLPELEASEVTRLPAAIKAMMAACILPSAERMAVASSQIAASRMERVRHAVRRHLRSPALGPALLCRQVGMSRSQLYRLLEGEGGVARYIQRQRLRESQAALSEAGGSRPIAAIAEELCFADASSFSRAFRHEFGVSPSDARAIQLAGLPPLARRRDGLEIEQRSFADTLYGFT